MRTYLFVFLGALLFGIMVALGVELVNPERIRQAPRPLSKKNLAKVPRFLNIAPRIGLKGQHAGDLCSANAAGAAWIDLDHKGSPELVLGSYSHKTMIWSVTHRRARPLVDLGRIRGATGLSAVDYDNDGWEDLLIATQRGPRLFKNNEGRLVDVTSQSGIPPVRLGMAGSWADINRDGLLDLALTQGNNCTGGGFHFARARIFVQKKPGRFRSADYLLSRPARKALGMAVAWTDLDNDGWIDLYLGNDYVGGVKNQAFRNVQGRLLPGFQDTEIEIDSMGIGLGDLNNDLRTDLAISNIEPINTLVSKGSAFKRTRLTAASPTYLRVTWGLIIEDFNNDGREDIWSPAGGIEKKGPSAQVLYLNQGKGGLIEVAAAAGLDQDWRGRSAAVADINRDGLPDVALANLNQKPALFLNRGSRIKGRWVDITLKGGMGSPLTPCGARATLQLAGRKWMRELECSSEGFLATSEKVLHFGLGKAAGEQAKVEVRWPDGFRSTYLVGLDRKALIER